MAVKYLMKISKAVNRLQQEGKDLALGLDYAKAVRMLVLVEFIAHELRKEVFSEVLDPNTLDPDWHFLNILKMDAEKLVAEIRCPSETANNEEDNVFIFERAPENGASVLPGPAGPIGGENG